MNSMSLKDKIKNLSTQLGVDSQILLKRYFMDKFLENISKTKYRESFILKGGVLISSMIGINLRTTSDIDFTVSHINISKEEIELIINDICKVESIISFSLTNIDNIREDSDYSGYRVTIGVIFDKIRDSFKIDISAGDIITPSKINYQYNVSLENNIINLNCYPIETILAEKFESVISRSIFNTRMRDYYDLYELTLIYKDKINYNTLNKAIIGTFNCRNTYKYLNELIEINELIKSNSGLIKLWDNYVKSNNYIKDVKYIDCIKIVEEIINNFIMSGVGSTDK